ncbi:hypothetical protein VTJ83DRAFT_7348 [Remersonia thermophila]|uniref:Kinetochore protein fta4 n=1 Tax=Remersonia thermophila TaxID=72144 RepID=A0ABR4D3D2_9PEZI
MTSEPPTILTLKQSFLTAQTRLLSQPLSPSPAWLHDNKTSNDPETPSLPEKAVHDALFKLNHRLQQHARRVYPPQATRHVAEQIDRLYWNAAEAAVGGGAEDDEGEDVEALRLGADLTNPSTITTLPPAWDDDHDHDPAAREQYAALASSLRDLAERKQQAAARVAKLRRMRALLEPFSPAPAPAPRFRDRELRRRCRPRGAEPDGDRDEGLGAVQENLVTRNGALEKELLRMRVLLARVSGRAELLREQQQQQQQQQQQASKGRKRGREGGQAAGKKNGPRARSNESPSTASAGSLFSERAAAAEDLEAEERRKVGMLLESF